MGEFHVEDTYVMNTAPKEPIAEKPVEGGDADSATATQEQGATTERQGQAVVLAQQNQILNELAKRVHQAPIRIRRKEGKEKNR
ncbi:unnamed protein product [Gongylonema pulchrum]|uniref:Ribonuclease E n=1 Tax=Gongylonema pulchrum TaxID=637853 RepID=A0A183DKQ6_9BILA|nr:unnamed protein product [Gongylonema pulchrum]